MILESALEGARFGLRAGRVEADRIDADALQRAVLDGGWDWLVLRQPCGLELEAERLRLLGLEPQQTDTLMTWQRTLPDCTVEMPGDIALEPARADDAEAITRLVEQVFERYPNHYTANPLLDPSLALQGYVEWALSHIGHPQRLCWVVRAGQGIAALSCSQHDAAGNAVGVLHGVHPGHAGQGLYRRLIEASLAHYREAGCERFRISTQAGNRTVQNLWSRLGFSIEASRSTLHLMPLLGRALTQPAQAFEASADADASLQAFERFDADSRPAAWALARRSLGLASGADPCSGAELRVLHWPCGQARLRQVSLLCDAQHRALAWLHSDLVPAHAAHDTRP